MEWESEGGQVTRETVNVARGERRAIAPPSPTLATGEPTSPAPPIPAPAPSPPAPVSGDVALDASSQTSPPASAVASSRPFAPIVFWVGAGVTSALGVITIASGVDTANKHQAFENDPNASADSGRAAELRTNVLIAATAVVAAATLAIGLFGVDWNSRTTAVGRASSLGGPILEF